MDKVLLDTEENLNQAAAEEDGEKILVPLLTPTGKRRKRRSTRYRKKKKRRVRRRKKKKDPQIRDQVFAEEPKQVSATLRPEVYNSLKKAFPGSDARAVILAIEARLGFQSEPVKPKDTYTGILIGTQFRVPGLTLAGVARLLNQNGTTLRRKILKAKSLGVSYSSNGWIITKEAGS